MMNGHNPDLARKFRDSTRRKKLWCMLWLLQSKFAYYQSNFLALTMVNLFARDEGNSSYEDKRQHTMNFLSSQYCELHTRNTANITMFPALVPSSSFPRKLIAQHMTQDHSRVTSEPHIWPDDTETKAIIYLQSSASRPAPQSRFATTIIHTISK